MFEKQDPKHIPEASIFSLEENRWALLTAGTATHHNTMTIGWGGVGLLWKKNVATIYVRPQRYTFEFLEKYPEFTLSFFEEAYRPKLALCGRESGREVDKIKECGFNTVMAGDTAPYFEEASLVLVCRKLYHHDFDPKNFADNTLEEFYQNDYHRMYMGEITQVLKKV